MPSLNVTTPIILCLLGFIASCDAPLIFPPDALLPDGSQYYGEVSDGLFHGEGKLVYGNGDHYDGDFFDGLMHGYGVFTSTTGEVYSGDFLNGQFTGQGKITGSAFNTEYIGEVKDWLYHGKGTLKSLEASYTGEFKNGQYHGVGTIVYSEDLKYSGGFFEGKMHGQGSMTTYGGVYEGTFAEDTFSGEGTFTNNEGGAYTGGFSDFSYHGTGTFTDPDGNQYMGNHEFGELTGKATYVGIDGTHYEGEFIGHMYHGEGHLKLPSGSEEYIGKFKWGVYEGEGVLRSKGPDGNTIEISGVWENGELLRNNDSGEYTVPQAELALENHQNLLKKTLDAISTNDPNAIEGYYLGIAGDGTQGVFQRELEFVSTYFNTHLIKENHGLSLINGHKTAEKYPLATIRSVHHALEAIAEKMDIENDILFMYLSSHGSEEHELLFDHDSIDLHSMSAQYLADALRDTGIKWKVIIVSACFSGGFIPILKDENSLIITASDAESSSFGCSDTSEMTNFGKALFRDTLSHHPTSSFDEAFDAAKLIIESWEKEKKLTASNPQIEKPIAILQHLQRWQQEIKER